MIMTDNWPHTCANSERDGRGNPKQAALEIAYYNMVIVHLCVTIMHK